MAAAAPTPLAAAIKAVREHVGSHDRFVAHLKDRYGLTKASRTLVIGWEKGAVPSSRSGYREALIAEGVPAALFTQPAVELTEDGLAIMREALSNQRRMRKDLAKVAEQVAGLAEDMTSVLRALGGEGGSQRSAGKPG